MRAARQLDAGPEAKADTGQVRYWRTLPNMRMFGGVMNSIIRGSGLAAFALCGTALVACDSVKDVREAPTFAIPQEKVSLTGTITGQGVGTTRPVGLKIVVTNDTVYATDNDDETDDGTRIDIVNGQPVRTTFFSIRGTQKLSFGAVDVGANYEISVTDQPFGRTCVPAQGASGTVTGAVDNIEIRCDRDSTALYALTASIDAGLASNLPPDFKLTLTTEEGVEEVTPQSGDTGVTFDLPVFYPAGNPPAFAYEVRATYVEDGITNNCAVTNGRGELGVGSGNVTNVTVTGCEFSIGAVVSYSAPAGAPPGPPPPVGSGLMLGLKDVSGAIVAETGTITTFSPTPIAFPGALASNASALYEVTVTSQPADQFCVVADGGLASLAAAASVTAQVYCRNIPAEANRLTGTYQVVLTPDAATTEDPRPLATESERHFMTFFANGTFLYGVHHSSTAVGVEHGFYTYSPSGQTLAFKVFTDSSSGFVTSCTFNFTTFVNTCPADGVFGAGGVSPPTSATAGLSGVSGFVLPSAGFPVIVYGPGGQLTATGVTKTAATPALDTTPTLPGDPILPAIGRQISLTFGTATWTLVEPISSTWGLDPADDEGDFWTAGESEGAWVTADSKQVWVYDKGTTYGWHAGVNGAPNLQDMCFGIELAGGALGYETFYSRRIAVPNDFFSSTCTPFGPSAGGVVDVPNVNSTPAIAPGFAGRFPGSSISTVLPPSPAYFGVTGTPETLTVQGTLNGQAAGEPVVFTRSVAN